MPGEVGTVWIAGRLDRRMMATHQFVVSDLSEKRFPLFGPMPARPPMIRIDQRAPVSNAGPTGSARRSSGASFSLPTQDSATASRSSGVGAAGPLDTLLAVQAQEDSQDRKRRRGSP